MATVTHVTTDVSDANATSFNPAAFASLSTEQWLAGVLVSDTNPAGTPTITKTGMTWTPLVGIEFDNAGTRRSLFVFRGEGTSASSAPTITCTEAVSGCGWSFVKATGIDMSAPVVGTPLTNNGVGDTVTVSVGSFASSQNQGVIFAATDQDVTFSTPSGWTVLGQDVSAGAAPVQTVASFTKLNGTSISALSTGDASQAWGGVLVEWKSTTTELAGASAGAAAVSGTLTIPVSLSLSGSSGGESQALGPLTVSDRPVSTPYCFPRVSLDVAWRTDPRSASPEWHDEGANLRELSTSRGRRRSLDRMEPGRLEAVLDNSGREYDPTNRASPYHPHVRPGRRMRVRAEWPWLPGLLSNPDFEAGTTYWSATNATLAASTAVPAFEKSQVARLSASAGGDVALSADTATAPAATAGTPYVATARVQAAGYARTCRVELRWLDSSRALLSTTAGTGVTSATADWTRLTVAGTAPAGTAYVGVRVVVAAAATAGEVHYVDAVVLWPARAALLEDVIHAYGDNYPTSWEKRYGEARVTATDAFKLFNLEPMALPYDLEVRRRTPTWRLRLDEEQGTVAADSSGHARDGTFSGSAVTYGQPDPFYNRKDGAVTLASGGYMGLPAGYTLATPFTLAFWMKCSAPAVGASMAAVHLLAGTGDSTRAGLWVWVMNTGGFYLEWATHNRAAGTALLTGGSVVDGSWHLFILQVSADGKTISLWKDNTTVGSSTSATAGPTSVDIGYARFGNIDINSGEFFTGSVADVALFPVAFTTSDRADFVDASTGWGTAYSSDDQVGALLDVMGWPTGDRDVGSGQSLMLPITQPEGSFLGQLQRIDETEGGAFYVAKDGRVRFRNRHAILQAPYTAPVAVLGDGDGELPYARLQPGYDEELVKNQVEVTRPADEDAGKGEVVGYAEDLDSVEDHGRRPVERTIYAWDDNEATAAAQWDLSHSKDPDLHVEAIELDPLDHPELWPHVLQRELEDRVRIVARPPGGGFAIVRDLHIQSIEHRVSSDPPRWRTTWWLSPAEAQPYLVLDDPLYGQLDLGRLAY